MHVLSQGLTLWLTGLSGSGKTTIALALKEYLLKDNPDFALDYLDGDEVREHLCRDLGFSREDRMINVERIAFLAGRIAAHKVLVLVPVIAPYREARAKAKALSRNFIEIYVKTSLEEVIRRDVKGLYRKALNNEIANFTGISDPYEEPESPDLVIETEKHSITEAVSMIVACLVQRGFIVQK